jgi:flagellar biosynthesis protein FliQ
MTESQALSIGHEALVVMFAAAGPVLIFGMLVGLLVSMVQAVTQLHEMTVPFAAKLLAMAFAILFFGPFIVAELVNFTTKMMGDYAPIIH